VMPEWSHQNWSFVRHLVFGPTGSIARDRRDRHRLRFVANRVRVVSMFLFNVHSAAIAGLDAMIAVEAMRTIIFLMT
jgi:hypothetical protein